MKRIWFADFSLLAIAFVWGATFVMVQQAITSLPPFSFLAVRFGLAFFLLLGLVPFLTSPGQRLNRDLLRSGLLLGLWLFLGYALQTFSLLYTTSGKSGFLTGISVALIPVFSLLILGIKPRTHAVVGVALAVLGLYLLAFADFSSVNRGDVLAFLCAISFGLQVVYTAKYAPGRAALPLVTVQVGLVAFLSTVFAFEFEPWQRMFRTDLLFHPRMITAILVTSVFATVLAYVGQTHFQKFTTPTRVALIFAMEPVFAALTDYWWMGETLSGRALVGCLLIFLGMILAELDSRAFPLRVWKHLGWKRPTSPEKEITKHG